jgi:regulator of replication initiation timing
MNQLKPIIKHGERLLTTAFLAKSYEAEKQEITNNFNRNKQRFQEGKHYFLLVGEELRKFKATTNQIEFSPNLNKLYLWTEKGAWLHAKSLNTDRAWNAYEVLVDEYYRIKDNVTPLSKDQALVSVLRTTADLVESQGGIIKEQHEIRKEITSLRTKVDDHITLSSGEQRKFQNAVSRKVYSFTQEKDEASRLYREIYREIKDRFAVASYKDVKRHELQAALNYVNNWIPRQVS